MKRLKYNQYHRIKILIEQFCLHKCRRWERKTKGLRGTHNFIKKIKIIKIYWKTLLIKFLPRHLFWFSIQYSHCWTVSPTGTFSGLQCEARFWKYSTVQVAIQMLQMLLILQIRLAKGAVSVPPGWAGHQATYSGISVGNVGKLQKDSPNSASKITSFCRCMLAVRACVCVCVSLTKRQSLFNFWLFVHNGMCASEGKIRVKHRVHHYSDLPHCRRFGVVNGMKEPLGWSVPSGTWKNKDSHADTRFISETEVDMKRGEVVGTVLWNFTLNSVAAVRHKCGTAKVDNPDVGSRGTRFHKNVLQFYVPVEHTPGVDPDESIYQLLDDSLSGTQISGKLGSHFSLCKQHVAIASVVTFKAFILHLLFLFTSKQL